MPRAPLDPRFHGDPVSGLRKINRNPHMQFKKIPAKNPAGIRKVEEGWPVEGRRAIDTQRKNYLPILVVNTLSASCGGV
jgi:hypothetical protein